MAGGGEGAGERIQHHMVNGARGQGAIQSNEIALGIEKEGEIMMKGRREGGRRQW